MASGTLPAATTVADEFNPYLSSLLDLIARLYTERRQQPRTRWWLGTQGYPGKPLLYQGGAPYGHSDLELSDDEFDETPGVLGLNPSLYRALPALSNQDALQLIGHQQRLSEIRRNRPAELYRPPFTGLLDYRTRVYDEIENLRAIFREYGLEYE